MGDGSDPRGSTVRLYTSSDCSGSPVRDGFAADLTSPGLQVSVANNSTTTFRGTATLGAFTSACSTSSITYVEDSTPPAAPTLTDTDPNSPADDSSPEIKGSAASGSIVRLFTSSDCTGPFVASGTAAEFASPGITVAVPDDSTTTFRASAIIPSGDGGSVSACSTSSITYVEDSRPALSISDVSITETTGASANAALTVSLSKAYSRAVTVGFTTQNGSATQPADYTTTSGTLTVPNGSLTQTISVPIAGDTLDEDTEGLSVVLSSPVNATIADGMGAITILDNDPPPALSIADKTVTEGDTGAPFTSIQVSLSAPSGKTSAVSFATANGSALAGSDYTATSGTLTFTPGSTSRVINVPIFGDTAIEPRSESYLVNLSGASNATISDAQAVVTIVDNDDKPPVIATRSNIVTQSASSPVAVAYTKPNATDDAGAPDVSCTPTSGSKFAYGTTTVTCTARDSLGQSATSTFTIAVQKPTTTGAVSKPGNTDKKLTDVSPGQRVRITAGGFEPRGDVAIQFLSSEGKVVDLLTTTSGDDGRIDIRTKVPNRAPDGDSQFMAVGSQGDFVRIWRVVVHSDDDDEDDD
jgi:hypothetical protein